MVWGVQNKEYLLSKVERLPSGVKAFAICNWYYDASDHRCPHDSWLEEFAILEPAKGERNHQRSIEIRLRLLGAYHDGHVFFRYLGVRRYSIETIAASISNGHGDFLADEFTLGDDGLVKHEIEFSRGSRFSVETQDIEFEFRVKPSPNSPEFAK